jgi:hypothetical protein
MKTNQFKDIRRPLPTFSGVSIPVSELLIASEYKDIINKHCPGKLFKLMKQRVKPKCQT